MEYADGDALGDAPIDPDRDTVPDDDSVGDTDRDTDMDVDGVRDCVREARRLGSLADTDRVSVGDVVRDRDSVGGALSLAIRVGDGDVVGDRDSATAVLQPAVPTPASCRGGAGDGAVPVSTTALLFSDKVVHRATCVPPPHVSLMHCIRHAAVADASDVSL